MATTYREPYLIARSTFAVSIDFGSSHLIRWRMIIALTLAFFSFFTTANVAHAQRRAPRPPVYRLSFPDAGRAVGSLTVTMNQGPQRVGSAFVVAPNKVVTSFQLMQGAKSAKFQLANGNSFDISGYTVARHGKDLILLTISKLSDNWLPLPLDPEEILPEQTELLPQIVVRNRDTLTQLVVIDPRPASYRVYLPRLHKKLRGDDFLQGIKSFDLNSAMRDRDTDWLVIDASFDSAAAGAPVWNPKTTRVVGMLTTPFDKGMPVRAAVSSKHIRELLTRPESEVLPLANLAKYVDPYILPTIQNSVRPIYDGFLVERLKRNLDRIAIVERAKATAERESIKLRDVAIEARTKADKANKSIAAIQPEVKVLERVPDPTIDPREARKRGPGNIADTVLQQVTRFSSRQEQAITTLRNEQVAQISIAIVAEFQERFLKEGEIPFVEERVRRAQIETFFYCDPFGVRSNDERKDLLKYFDETISQGGAPGWLFVMRAVAKTELEDYEGARRDLDDAYQIDSRLENLITAVRGRLNLLTKKDKEGKDQISRAMNAAPNDYRILAIAARAELDQGQFANVRKLITTIQQAGVNVVELEVTQAWLNLGLTNGDPVNTKLAMSCARDACLQGDFDDWLALGTLAAVHAVVKDFDEAKKLMDRVNQIAPLQRTALVEEWTRQLEKKEAWTSIVK